MIVLFVVFLAYCLCLLLNLILRNHSRCIIVGRSLQQRFLSHLVIHLLTLILFQLLYAKVSVLIPPTLSLNFSYGHLSSSIHAFTTSLNSIVVPKYVQEVMSIPGWKSVMEAKMSTLSQNATWSLVVRCIQ